MVEAPEAIRLEIDQRREAISRDVDSIEQRAKSLTDWRQHIEDRPLTALAVAFGGGALLGAMLAPTDAISGRHSYANDRDRWNGSVGSHDNAGYSHSRSPQASDSALSDKIDQIRGALLGLAATKAEAYLRELLPGFAEEVNKARRQSTSQAIDQHASSSRAPFQAGLSDDARFEAQGNMNLAGRVPDPAGVRPPS